MRWTTVAGVAALWMSLAAEAPAAQDRERWAVIVALRDAVNAGRIDEAMGLFGDSAMLKIRPGTIYAGPESIAGLLRRLHAGGVRLQATERRILGDKVEWEVELRAAAWQQRGVDALRLTADTMVFAGRIQLVTLEYTAESAELLPQLGPDPAVP
jgi:hypothetical protein